MTSKHMNIIGIVLIVPYLSYISSQVSFQSISYKTVFNTSDFTKEFPLDYYTSCTAIRRIDDPTCCNCANDCYEKLDCCVDKSWIWDNSKIQQQYKNIIEKTKTFVDLFECEYLLPTYGRNDIGITMIKSCSNSFLDSFIKSQCLQEPTGATSWAHIWPVFDEHGNIYRNQFCATCNTVQNFTFLSIDAKCEQPIVVNNENLLEMLKTNVQSCSFEYHEVKGVSLKSRQCVPSRCNKGHQYYDLCRSYSSPMSNGVHVFRNYHCYLCYRDQIKDGVTPQLSSGCGKIIQAEQLCSGKTCVLPNGQESSLEVTSFQLTLQNNVPKVSNFKQKFPIREFYKIPTSYTFPKDVGLEQYLCGQNIRDKCCSCETDCMITHTCCIDVFWNQTNPITLNKYIKTFTEEALSYKPVVCTEVFPNAAQITFSKHKSVKRLMVVTCPHDVSDSYKSSCSQHAVKPVVGTDGYLYKNEFCAICNFIQDFKPVNISVSCQEADENVGNEFQNKTKDLNLLPLLKYCTFDLAGDNIYMPPKTHNTGKYGTKCSETVKYNSSCKVGNPNYDLCQSYTAPLGYNEHKNLHCLACNVNNVSIESLKIQTCDCGSPGSNCIINPTAAPYFGWSLFISFSGETTLRSSFAGKEQNFHCKNNTVLNILTGKCEPFICPDSYVKTSSGCVQGNQRILNLTNPNFEKCLLAQPKVLFLFNGNIMSNSSIISFIQSSLDIRNKPTVLYTDHFETMVSFPLQINNTTLQELSKPSLFTIDNLKEIIITSNGQLTINSMYKTNISHYFKNNKICSLPFPQTIDDLKFTSTCLFDNKESLLLMHYTKTSIQRSLYVCNTFHLQSSCPLRVLNNNTSIDKNLTLKYTNINKQEEYFLINQYIPINKSFAVCINTTNTSHVKDVIPDWLKDLQTVEYHFSWVLTPVSIICYVWIIVTFLRFEEYHKIPSQCVVGMCIFLLTSDIIFLITLEEGSNDIICKMSAIILHWTLLVSFMWTVVIAFDLVMKFRILSNITKGSDEKFRRKMFQRYIIAISPPTFIVLLTILLDETSSLNIGYGEENICWIAYLDARLGSYIIPVALIFCSTLAALCYTLRIVSITAKQSGERLKHTNHNNINVIKIAIKLSIILGITECIGFIQITNPTDNELKFNASLAFIYSLLRSCRGLLLWFVYLAEDVYKQYIKWFQQQYNLDDSIPSTSPTSPLSNNNSTSTPLSTRVLMSLPEDQVFTTKETKMQMP